MIARVARADLRARRTVQGRTAQGRAAAWAVALAAAIVPGVDLHAAGAPGVVSVMGRTGEPRIGQVRAPGRPAAGTVAADDAIADSAHSDWVLHCMGCHTATARGAGSGRVPDLAGTVGWYLQVPQGRAYLAQVPGVNNAGLDDRRIAAVVNYVIDHFAGESRPADFTPYTADEVARHRAERPVDIAQARRRLLEARSRAGLPAP